MAFWTSHSWTPRTCYAHGARDEHGLSNRLEKFVASDNQVNRLGQGAKSTSKEMIPYGFNFDLSIKPCRLLLRHTIGREDAHSISKDKL